MFSSVALLIALFFSSNVTIESERLKMELEMGVFNSAQEPHPECACTINVMYENGPWAPKPENWCEYSILMMGGSSFWCNTECPEKGCRFQFIFSECHEQFNITLQRQHELPGGGWGPIIGVGDPGIGLVSQCGSGKNRLLLLVDGEIVDVWQYECMDCDGF